MDVYEALYTTRAMRRVKSEQIPIAAQKKILDAAIRAPNAGNMQNWQFLLLDSPKVKSELGPLYRDGLARMFNDYSDLINAAHAEADRPDNAQLLRNLQSGKWLAGHFEEVPLFMFAFIQNDVTGGASIYPAVWSAQLAARAEGIGSALTTVLSALHEKQTMDILEVPPDSGWTLACTCSFGYPTGRWNVPNRRPAHHVSSRNSWTGQIGFEVNEPLWSGLIG